MNAAIIFILLLVLMLTGMPISISLGLTVLTFLFGFTNVPLESVALKLFTGIEKFEIMAIPFFILAGNFLTHGGVARRMINFASSMVGHWYGGLGLAGVLACALFAAVSGSSPATVVAIGSILLPAMVKAGFPRSFGAGVITTSGALGILIPPSIVMVMYSVATNTSVGALFMAGVVPGIALAAVLGGTQSLHTNSMDETLALPTEEAVKLALRTQQIIATESEIVNTVDPLGGSFFVESLTNRLEEGAQDYFRRLDEMGGMIRAIEQGFPQREILEASQRYQRQLERGARGLVGVTDHAEETPCPIPILRIGPEVEQEQVARLSDLRKSRDPFRMAGALEEVQEAAACHQNVIPSLIEAVQAKATVGEICSALREVYGTYREPVVL